MIQKLLVLFFGFGVIKNGKYDFSEEFYKTKLL